MHTIHYHVLTAYSGYIFIYTVYCGAYLCIKAILLFSCIYGCTYIHIPSSTTLLYCVHYHCYPSAVSPHGSVVVTPDVLFVDYGDNVTLHCETMTGPGNEYHWEHNGVTLDGENGPYLIVNNSLVDPSTLGTYTCIVSNVAGRGKASSVIHGKLHGNISYCIHACVSDVTWCVW